MFSVKKYLVADIGGTNANFAIIDQDYKMLFKTSFKSKDYKNFDDVLQSFLDIVEVKKHNFDEVCIAMAGPISKDRKSGTFTNLSWNIDTDSLKEKFKFNKIYLINDFEAIGYAYDIMKTNQCKEITSLGRNTRGVISIIGPGTGLGTSILTDMDKKHVPIPSEGSRTNLCIDIKDPLELELYRYIQKKDGFVETESILSGRGLATIYEFLVSKRFKHNLQAQKEIKKSSADSKSKIIVKYALSNKDPACLKTIEIFIKFYARTAKNLALLTLCNEIVLAGGITIGIISFLEEIFIEEFTSHNAKEARNILENITIVAITDYDISLYGAANALSYHL